VPGRGHDLRHVRQLLRRLRHHHAQVSRPALALYQIYPDGRRLLVKEASGGTVRRLPLKPERHTPLRRPGTCAAARLSHSREFTAVPARADEYSVASPYRSGARLPPGASRERAQGEPSSQLCAPLGERRDVDEVLLLRLVERTALDRVGQLADVSLLGERAQDAVELRTGQDEAVVVRDRGLPVAVVEPEAREFLRRDVAPGAEEVVDQGLARPPQVREQVAARACLR